MITRARLCLLAASLAVAARAADPEAVKTSGSAELWAYGTALDRVGPAPLNPGNRVAQLPGLRWTGEARVNLRLTTDRAEFVLRPRLLAQHPAGTGVPGTDQGYLSQAFARIRLDDTLALTAGRELLTWGPGNFRSPSNPLYFDAGRTDPLREVAGVDLVRLTWTHGPVSAMLAHEQDAGHLDRAATPERVTLGKVDLRGADWQISGVLATPVWGTTFLGAFAQATLGQAWLVYGEIGSGRRRQALEAAAEPFAAPFTVRAPSPRESTALLGASYTLPNGQSVTLEGLRDGHGFSRPEEARYLRPRRRHRGPVPGGPGFAPGARATGEPGPGDRPGPGPARPGLRVPALAEQPAGGRPLLAPPVDRQYPGRQQPGHRLRRKEPFGPVHRLRRRHPQPGPRRFGIRQPVPDDADPWDQMFRILTRRVCHWPGIGRNCTGEAP